MTERRVPTERPPDIEVIDALDYWNGVTQFLARYVEWVGDNGLKIYRLAYGCVTEESDGPGLDSDDPRTYNLWALPPGDGPDWQIGEKELVYADKG